METFVWQIPLICAIWWEGRIAYLNGFSGFVETMNFTTNCKLPVNGGDSACPPEPPLRFAIVSYYLLWNYRSKGCHSGGGGSITYRSPQRALRKYFEEFY